MGRANVMGWNTSAAQRSARRNGRRKVAAAALMEIVELESRLLYCANGTDFSATVGHDNSPFVTSGYQLMGPFVSFGGPALAGSPLSSVPALNSNSSATATLYIDFVGASAQSWGGYNVTATPAFDQDGDASTFSDSELANIRQIWARVAEAYSPFNLNVTTVDPGNLNDGQTLKVVVGGSGGWLGAAAGGVSFIGSFTNGSPNVAWVFPNMLGGGNAKYTGDAIVHESGHGFGLLHQSSYSGSTKTAEYRAGNGTVAAYMGLSYYSTRGKWSNGQSSANYAVYQDDMAIISGATNNFGYRTDDHGDTIGAADALTVSDATVTGSGVLSKTGDVDVFSFVTSAGTVSFSVNVADYGATLDSTLKLVDLAGNVIASSDTASLGESLTTSVGAGSYRLIVSSKGVYGDVGQYTITGTIVPSPNYVAPPSNLAATRAAGGVTLSWYDNSWNETAYAIQRSDDGGATWNNLDPAAANVHGYLDSTATVGHSYQYRVYALNDTDQSGNSNTAAVSVTPSTPGSLSASSISASRIDLSWADVEGESGYVIERSINGTTWSQIATPGADSSSYSDTGLAAGTKYYYRIRANSAVGASANAVAVNSTTRATAPGLTLTVISSAQINLAWTNVLGETGYRIERSLNGSDWSVIATTGANVTTISSLGLTAGTVYSYRVFAVNAGGDSLAGSTYATTVLVAPTGTVATGVSTGEIDLVWNNSEGETGYRIERSIDERTWATVATVGADVTSYANTGLAGGTRYIYRVRALNAGGASAPSTGSGVYTVPLAPNLVGAVASNTQINVNWTNVAGETNYVLQRSDNGTDGWTTIASPLANVIAFSNTGLTADSSYFYRVIAHNASGDSASSVIFTARTLLPAPTSLTATGVSISEIDLAWADSTNETGYRVERSLNETTWATIATLGPDVTSYANTGLTGGTRYIYRVRAINPGGASAASTSASTYTIPLAPNLVGTVASDTQINVNWTNVAGETGYVLERSDNGTDGWTTLVSPLANVITFSNTGLTADTSYFYRVTAHNASGDSAASVTFTAHTLLPAVTGLSATGISTTQVNLAWDDSTGESGYRVERSLNGSTWALLTTTAADVHEYSNTGLVAGTAYYYRVRAVNAGGNSLVGDYKTGITIPPATTLTVLSLSTSQIRLSWLNVAGETGYRVERSADGVSDWGVVNTAAVNAITFIDTALTTDTPYFYRVTPVNGSGDAAASIVKTTRTLLPAPTSLTATAASTTQINLAWSNSDGETAYVIERSLNNGSTWAVLTTVAADVTSYSNTGLTAGATYAYRIRAANAGGNSEAGIKATTITLPATANLVATAASTSQINLVWSNIAGESGYRLETSANGTDWTTLATTAVNVVNYSNTALDTDSVHYYRVTPFNASGDGATTTINRRTLLAAPTNIAATPASATSITVNWDNSSGESGYRIERLSGSVWVLAGTTAADVTSFTSTGLTPGRTYYFRVRAVNDAGVSAVSATVYALTPLSSRVFQSRRLIA
ncbi:MAG: repeat-containing protein [Phycisphaerales bacterium]|nr:repeat-containing protein [Phycisphaerales bacterium]